MDIKIPFLNKQPEEQPAEIVEEEGTVPLQQIPEAMLEVIAMLKRFQEIDFNQEEWRKILTEYGLSEFYIPEDLVLGNLRPAERFAVQNLFESAKNILAHFGHFWAFRRAALSMIIDAVTRINSTRSVLGWQQKNIIAGITGKVPHVPAPRVREVPEYGGEED